jgi:hypothetical protein
MLSIAMRPLILVAALGIVALAPSQPAAAEPGSQLQADLGLSVVCLGYEHPVGGHAAVMLGAGLFGTYFLPWFDRGDDVAGAIADLRATWFAGDDHHGLYVTPYVRGGYADGAAVTAGAFVGYALGLGRALDLRLGGGAQYLAIDDHAHTPFIALDVTLGYRL